MKKKRKYTDESGADKGAIHLMINRTCTNSCPLCCNRQYDLDTVPIATVEELKAAHTVLLTGGEPFYSDNIEGFCSHLRHDYSNVKQLYIYTSGSLMYRKRNNLHFFDILRLVVDGINFSPKTTEDYFAIQRMMCVQDIALEIFPYVRNNRIILTPNDFMTREGQEEFIKSLPLEGLAFYGAKFDVEYREWQKDFKPNGGVWRRLPVFL